MDKILVAIDESDSCDRALIRAIDLATSCESSITLLHVIEDNLSPTILSLDSITIDDVLLQKELEKKSERLLDSYRLKAKDFCGKLETLTRSGKPANEIIDVAEKEDYDLIIIGKRGSGDFPGAMLGSVSNKVVNKSNVDVLTVR